VSPVVLVILVIGVLMAKRLVDIYAAAGGRCEMRVASVAGTQCASGARKRT
jgi:hypothetical protein